MPSSFRFPRLRTAVAVAAAGALALALTACGGGSSSGTAATSSAGATSASSSAGASSGASSGASGSSAADSAAFPVTIKHAYGETTIESAPERVATWGWASADAALALGVVPVAIPQQIYGGDAQGVLPWIAEKLAAEGAATPAILSSTDQTSAPLEQILAARPDVLLAQYSGLTQQEYDRLTEAGVKVVAYPQTAWSTPWRDVVTIAGEALGRTAEAEQVLADIDAAVAAQAAAHPEFAGVTFASAFPYQGSFSVYTPADPRVEFVTSLGLVSADSVTALDTKEATFYFTLAAENYGQLTADLLLLYSDTDATLDAFLATPEAALLPQKNGGKIARVIGQAEVASVSPPTALSVTWGLDKFVDDLATAING